MSIPFSENSPVEFRERGISFFQKGSYGTLGSLTTGGFTELEKSHCGRYVKAFLCGVFCMKSA